MSMLTYGGAGVLAILVTFITNHQILLTSQRHATKERIAYKQFVLMVVGFFLADAAWGFVATAAHPLLLKADTAAIYLTMTLSVILCYRYVTIFLHYENFATKNIRALSLTFIVAALILLAINWFYPLLFWYDESGNYHMGNSRNMVMSMQVFWFAFMTAVSLRAFFKATSGIVRNRNRVISMFSTVMALTSTAQWIFPMMPLNTIGFCIGLLIIHTFIMEDEYRRELSRVKVMLDSSNVGTWQLNCKNGTNTGLVVDEKMKELMGIANSNFTDKEVNEILVAGINPDDLPAFMEYDKQLKSGMHTEITYRWAHPTLGERYVRCGGAPMKNENDIYMGYHSDVTEQVMKEKELKHSIEANKIKTRFLQNMSHEIRTPLNAMFGFAQLLGMPDGSWTDEEKEKYNTYIYNSYNMMDMLISDILDAADAEHGNYQIVSQSIHVNSVCRFSLMAVEFRRSGSVEMNFTTEVDDNYTIMSDARRIQQVLVNFLSNACKNTEMGSIHLHCSTTEKPGMLTFSVTDTGKGIPAEKAEEIFGRFTKLNPHVQGSGLGLNICHLIATKMGGEVYLDTSYTQGGARFVFTVPLSPRA